MLHVWYIYLQNWVTFRAHVGKYSSTMEHMGYGHLKYQISNTPGGWKKKRDPAGHRLCAETLGFFGEKKMVMVERKGTGTYTYIIFILYIYILYTHTCILYMTIYTYTYIYYNVLYNV